MLSLQKQVHNFFCSGIKLNNTPRSCTSAWIERLHDCWIPMVSLAPKADKNTISFHCSLTVLWIGLLLWQSNRHVTTLSVSAILVRLSRASRCLTLNRNWMYDMDTSDKISPALWKSIALGSWKLSVSLPSNVFIQRRRQITRPARQDQGVQWVGQTAIILYIVWCSRLLHHDQSQSCHGRCPWPVFLWCDLQNNSRLRRFCDEIWKTFYRQVFYKFFKNVKSLQRHCDMKASIETAWV